MGDDLPAVCRQQMDRPQHFVSGQHYANDVPDELFDRAATAGQYGVEVAAQNDGAASGGIASH